MGFKGTAAKDKISVSDLKKLKNPPKAKINGSPSALKFARDNGIDLSGFVGSGEDGKIMLKDVKALKPDEPLRPMMGQPGPSTSSETETPQETEKESGLKITPAAAKAIQKYGIDEEDLSGVSPSGKNGEILLKDLKELIDLFKAEQGEEVSSDNED